MYFFKGADWALATLKMDSFAPLPPYMRRQDFIRVDAERAPGTRVMLLIGL